MRSFIRLENKSITLSHVHELKCHFLDTELQLQYEAGVSSGFKKEPISKASPGLGTMAQAAWDLGWNEGDVCQRDLNTLYRKKRKHILEAIKLGLTMEFFYADREDNTTHRAVTPNQLYYTDGIARRMKGYCHLCNEDRSFLLEHMKGIRVLKPKTIEEHRRLVDNIYECADINHDELYTPRELTNKLFEIKELIHEFE